MTGSDIKFSPDVTGYHIFTTESRGGNGSLFGLVHDSLLPHLGFFTEEIKNNLSGTSARIISERPNWVAAARLPFEELAHPDVLVKRFGSRSVFHRLADPFVSSRPLRAMRTALWMREAGVWTPEPLLSVEKRLRGFVLESWLITELVPDAVKVREILRSNPADSPRVRKVLAVTAASLRRLHDAGILHRDLTLGNFLWNKETPERVYLVDLSRAVRFRRLPSFLRMLDLARLNLGAEWTFFFSLYCQGDPSLLRLRKLLLLLVRMRRNTVRFKKSLRGRPT